MAELESDRGIAVSDWTGRFHGRACRVEHPRSTDDVKELVDRCRQSGTPMHLQGGNTSLVGGTIPAAGQLPVLVNTTKLTRLDPISPDGIVVVGAGTTMGELQAHARASGWIYGVDMASRDSATVGGSVATNAGGIRVCAYGMTRQQVVGIEAVLADGSVVSHLTGLRKDNTGYDLAALFTGSEGTLGVITAVAVQLHRPPQDSTLALVGARDIPHAQQLVRQASSRSRLLAAELCDQVGLQLVCQHRELPWPLEQQWPWVVLIDVESDQIDLPADSDAVIAVDQTTADRFWTYREALPEVAGWLGDSMSAAQKLDISVPTDQLDSLVTKLTEAMAELSSVQAWQVFGHLADGNLHVALAGPAADDDHPTEVILRLVSECGGAVSAEHGIGTAKVNYLSLSRTPEEIAAMRAIKAALDPAGLFNRGVLFSEREDTND